MKYIDADKLKSEIKIIQQSLESRDVRLNQVKKIRTECMIEFCKCVFDVIDSLPQEQPEVDLEKEVEKYLLDNADFITRSTSNEMVNTLARHFYELGLNTRK